MAPPNILESTTGDNFQVQVNGQRISAVVPPNTKPGQKIRLNLPQEPIHAVVVDSSQEVVSVQPAHLQQIDNSFNPSGRRDPYQCLCPNCHHVTLTRVGIEPGLGTWAICAGVSLP